MISHVTVGSNDIVRAKAFYEKVMAPLGYARVYEAEDYFAYGETEASPPCFWVLPPFDGRPAERGNGWHCAFLAPSRAGPLWSSGRESWWWRTWPMRTTRTSSSRRRSR